MTKMFMANLYRMRKYRLTRHLLLPVCFFAIVCAIVLETDGILRLSGSTVMEELLLNLMPFLDFFLVPVLVHFVCHAFRDRTAELERMSGYSIHQMIMGRIMTVSLAVMTVVVIMAAAAIMMFTLKNGWAGSSHDQWGNITSEAWGAVTAANIAGWVYLSLFTILQFTVITVLAACICKDSGLALLLALVINLLGLMVEPMMMDMLGREISADMLEFNMAFFPGCQMMLVGNEIEIVVNTMADNCQKLFLSEYLLPISAAGILEVALLYVFAYYAVKKRMR